MKVINYIIISLLALAASALTTHCEDQAQELSMFYSTPEAIKPGVETTFTFIFNVAMDVSENPRVSFRLPDNSVMAFKAYWDDDFSCVISCTFPESRGKRACGNNAERRENRIQQKTKRYSRHRAVHTCSTNRA